MTNPTTHAFIAQANAIKLAMERIYGEKSEDFGKWSSAPTFANRYNILVNGYSTATGDKSPMLFEENATKRSFDDMTWPEQKSLFDTVYTELGVFIAIASSFTKPSPEHIYNFLVSGNEDSWNGDPFKIESSRCVREYTDPKITDLYGDLSKESCEQLLRAPTIFAYEISQKNTPPKFGYITEIRQQRGEVRLKYKILDVPNFLSAADLKEMNFELDIGKNELYRTHWAVKEINLPKELSSKGIKIPNAATDIKNAVDVASHIFDVALSFPGEVRTLVEEIALELERNLGPNRYFYDRNYTSQLARPSLDTLLQGIYSRAKLTVVFVGGDYQKKDWCGVEFRAVKDVIAARKVERVMFIRIDNGDVEGVFKTDGYIDASAHTPPEIAQYIIERISLSLTPETSIS